MTEKVTVKGVEKKVIIDTGSSIFNSGRHKQSEKKRITENETPLPRYRKHSRRYWKTLKTKNETKHAIRHMVLFLTFLNAFLFLTSTGRNYEILSLGMDWLEKLK